MDVVEWKLITIELFYHMGFTLLVRYSSTLMASARIFNIPWIQRAKKT